MCPDLFESMQVNHFENVQNTRYWFVIHFQIILLESSLYLGELLEITKVEIALKLYSWFSKLQCNDCSSA
jgi:hypothetical protein